MAHAIECVLPTIIDAVLRVAVTVLSLHATLSHLVVV
jgi:hypothetical protein